MYRWILLFLLILCCPAKAQQLNTQLESISSIKRALQSDPRELKNIAERALDDTTLDKNSVVWLHAFTAYTLAVNELGSLDPLRQKFEDLQNSMALALKWKLYEEYALLRYVWIFVPDQQGNTRDEVLILNELVKFADKYDVPNARVKTRMDLAYNLREKGESKQSLAYLNEMNDILQKHPEIDLVDRLIVQNQSAIAFMNQGQYEQSLSIHESIASICKREGLSYLGSIMENHVGDYYLNKGDRASLDQAEFHYRNALQVTKKQANEWLEATVSLNLARILLLRGQGKEAMPLAERTLLLFKSNDDVVGMADVLFVQGLIEIDAKQWKSAATYLDQSEKIYAEQGFKKNVLEITEARSRVEEGRGDLRKALDLIRIFVSDFRRQMQDTSQKNFSEMLVGMGLKVEAERNKSLAKENELQSKELSASRKIRVALFVVIVLAFGILALLLQVAKRSRMIRDSKVKIQRILDHIEEGIFTINAQLRIEQESSKFLLQIFDLKEAPTGHDALDILLGQSQLNAEERSQVREVIKVCLGEDLLAFDLNEAHLPREIFLHGETLRTILVHWTPLLDHDKKVQGFLVNLHDATEERRLAAAVEAEKTKSHEREQRILEIVRAERTALRKVFSDVHRVLENLTHPTLSEEQIQDAFRDLHTIKGVSRTLGIRAMSLATHVLEGELLLLRDQSVTQRFAWLKHLDHYRTKVEEYELLLQQLEQGNTINAAEDGNLAREVGRQQNMLVKLLKRQKVSCERFEVIDNIVQWPENLLQATGEILVHGLANSVDHGFNLPKIRGLSVPTAKFKIRADRDESGVFSLEISDNGLGLDLDLLKALGKQRAWTGDTFEELTPMLFLDGLSTAEKATATSGRGVGLSAIKAIADRWKGSAELLPNSEGVGCCLRIKLRQEQSLAASA